ncbi:MAG: alpha/beta hydrolase [candidate division WOR-3 bacterium]|nr:alpha/beta hydrolase [candidate division WOR-3 bacterium]MCX7947482.1 alpha/beta hydrolase [candidate division WOR-3 bacterium]MDW8150641.1 alpha/beta hydrolase [candidate division WOR-3 bacterium]
MKLIFIHGAGGSHLNWLLITRELKQFHVINFDFPTLESIEEYENFYGKFIDQESIIIAHSMGGAIGYYLSIVNNYIKSLVLVNSAIFEKFNVELEKEKICERLYFSKELVEDCKKRNYLIFKNFQTLQKHIEILNKFDAFFYLEKFRERKIPAFHIIGKSDKVVSFEVLKKTSNLLSVKKNYIIENCGHMPHIEKPKEFLHALKDILINLT